MDSCRRGRARLARVLLAPALVLLAVCAAWLMAAPARGQAMAALQIDPPRLGAPQPAPDSTALGTGAPLTAAPAAATPPIQSPVQTPAVTTRRVVPASLAAAPASVGAPAEAIPVAGVTNVAVARPAAAPAVTHDAIAAPPAAAPTALPATMPAVVEAAPAQPAPTARTAPRAALPAAAPTPAPAAAPAATTSAIEEQPITPPGPGAADASKGPTVSEPPAHTSMFGSSTMQLIAGMAIVLGLILIGKAIFVRVNPAARAAASGKGMMEVLARYPIGHRQSLVMVRIGSQVVVLCQTPQGSQSVLVVSDQAEVARLIGQVQGQQWNSIQGGFNSLLSGAQKELETGVPEDDPAGAAFERGQRRTLADALQNAEAESRLAPDERPEDDPEALEEELDEMAAARRQLLELRKKVQTISASIRS